MKDHTQDALENAERLYAEYIKLSQLGGLGIEREERESKPAIVGSLSPALCESFRNAIVG